jgi:hypothetical protein
MIMRVSEPGRSPRCSHFERIGRRLRSIKKSSAGAGGARPTLQPKSIGVRLYHDYLEGLRAAHALHTEVKGEHFMEKSVREELVERARLQLEGAIACLDELGCHQAAAHTDMALNLLRADPQALHVPTPLAGAGSGPA